MKKSIFLFGAILIMAGITTKVNGQGATVTGTTAGAEIMTPITLSQNANLHFGTLSVTAVPGTCVLHTDVSRSATGGVNISAASPAAANAGFDVTGQLGASYIVTFPLGTITVNDGALHTMTIDTWTVLCTSTGSDGTTGTIDAGTGLDNFVVGATLHVGSSQVAGSYSGVFNVNVDYN